MTLVISKKVRETAAEFLSHSSKNDALKYFTSMCEEAKVQPTKRQVRKYRNRRGAAYRASLGRSQDNHEANRRR